jgi:membrane-bound lytic murein transglycosylase B
MSIRLRMIVSALLFCGIVSATPVPYPQRPEVQAYIQELVKAHGFKAEELEKLLAGVQQDAEVLGLAAPPPTTHVKNWRVYRSRFLDRKTIRQGAEFWREHATALARAEKEFGVPAEVIAGILGVETRYGRTMGRFPVLGTLVTLAFDYPEAPNREARTRLFRQQLSEYLVWCRDTKQDMQAFTGSYTGAIGIPQFLPGSIRAYAVDFDGDGRVDLRGSAVDAIGSVASFLKAHGWRVGEPVQWPLALGPRSRKLLAAKADGDPNPKHSLEELLKAGLRPVAAPPLLKAQKDVKVILVDLPSPRRATEYHLGFPNFYAITRYNRSFFYAMAVTELGRAVKAAALAPRPAARKEAPKKPDSPAKP